MKEITILLVDDHRLLRDSWSAVLNSDNRLLVIGHTGDGDEAIEMVSNLKSDIVLMDLNMTLVDGFAVTSQVCIGESPSKVIGVSINGAIGSVKRLLTLGARGYLTKNSSEEE